MCTYLTAAENLYVLFQRSERLEFGKIRHKGLKRYIQKGDSSKLPAEHLPKIDQVLDLIEAAPSANDLPRVQPGIETRETGCGCHSLKGNYKGFLAFTITGPMRLIFRPVGSIADDLDYLDYH